MSSKKNGNNIVVVVSP